MMMVKNAFRRTFGTLVKKTFEKRPGGSGVIVAAVLLVIAVVLLITFRTAITGWLQSLITYFGTQFENFTA